MATACKIRTERRSLPSLPTVSLRKPVLKACFDLEEKARYQELLASLNINSTPRRPLNFDISPSPSPSTSCQLNSSLQELRRLQRMIYTSPISANNRFSSSRTQPTSFNGGRFKSVFAFAKHSLEDLDRFNFAVQPPKITTTTVVPENTTISVSSTPDVISLDGEDILANYEREKKATLSSKNSDTSSSWKFLSTPDLNAINKRFENDPTKTYLKLQNEYLEDRALRRRQLEELSVEADLRQKARQAKQKLIDDEIRFRIRFEGLILAEPEEEEEIVIELTDEQLTAIGRALVPGNSQEILIEAFNIQIKRSDIQTLAGLNWLNDEVVNFYFNLLMDRGGKNQLPSVYVFNTFFYPKLCQGGHAALKRWTRRVDIFSYDLVLIPIHLGVHWCLAVVDFRKNEIVYYDSMGGGNRECIEALKNRLSKSVPDYHRVHITSLQNLYSRFHSTRTSGHQKLNLLCICALTCPWRYLKDESAEKKKQNFDIANWKGIFAKNIPQQMNGSDCGVFTCKFADYVSRNCEINFSQEHMPYFRKRMIYEILTKHLLW